MGEVPAAMGKLPGGISATPYLLKFPQKRMWIDYDKEADVLYINFKRPQKATDSEMTKEGILSFTGARAPIRR
jgi:hypothetical protein